MPVLCSLRLRKQGSVLSQVHFGTVSGTLPLNCMKQKQTKRNIFVFLLSFFFLFFFVVARSKKSDLSKFPEK